MENKKAINLVKEVRKMENEMYSQACFCRDHNFNLEADKFSAMESQLRKVTRLIEKEFDLPYIPYE